jgi:glycerate-2-kinase
VPEADDRLAGFVGMFDAAYRAGVQGADAYRGVRAALRRQGPTVRLGNRFLPIASFREIGFLAVGSAATSLALGTVAALGERATQGFVAGPEPLPPEVPFRSTQVVARRAFRDAGEGVSPTALEMASGLDASDLLIVLLSSGALLALAEPPEGLGAGAWADGLAQLRSKGASAPELARFVRVVGGGAIGGALAAATSATVVTLVVSRGEPASLVAGGPTWPVTRGEREEVRALVERWGVKEAFGPTLARRVDPGASSLPTKPPSRPVIVAEPPDALRDASQALAERRWIPRLAGISFAGRPEQTAATFAQRVEEVASAVGGAATPLVSEVAAAEAGDEGIGLPPGWAAGLSRLGSSLGGPRESRGVAVFGATTLDVVDGIDPAEAEKSFLAAAAHALRHRHVALGVFRTSGGAPTGPDAPGGFVRATDAVAGTVSGRFLMRGGITEVGHLLVGLVPRRDAPAK